ncbi:MAG: two-component system response regulator [Desulfobacterales bacterium PC51MH44]|nr:MAG: two-component system response regulator [Desulfobacterales bacterium PC51MH44]
MRSSNPILLVEDDDVDVMTVKRALKDLDIKNQLVCTANGEDALEYLKNNGNKKPCIILLDLNMPKMNGIEFLQIVKADDTLKEIPVIVLTTSSQQQDIAESFKLSVAGYIVKSVDYAEYTEAINTINLYWTLSKLPSNGD